MAEIFRNRVVVIFGCKGVGGEGKCPWILLDYTIHHPKGGSVVFSCCFNQCEEQDVV